MELKSPDKSEYNSKNLTLLSKRAILLKYTCGGRQWSKREWVSRVSRDGLESRDLHCVFQSVTERLTQNGRSLIRKWKCVISHHERGRSVWRCLLLPCESFSTHSPGHMCPTYPLLWDLSLHISLTHCCQAVQCSGHTLEPTDSEHR